MSNIYRLIAFYDEAQKQLDFFNVFFFHTVKVRPL